MNTEIPLHQYAQEAGLTTPPYCCQSIHHPLLQTTSPLLLPC